MKTPILYILVLKVIACSSIPWSYDHVMLDHQATYITNPSGNQDLGRSSDVLFFNNALEVPDNHHREKIFIKEFLDRNMDETFHENNVNGSIQNEEVQSRKVENEGVFDKKDTNVLDMENVNRDFLMTEILEKISNNRSNRKEIQENENLINKENVTLNNLNKKDNKTLSTTILENNNQTDEDSRQNEIVDDPMNKNDSNSKNQILDKRIVRQRMWTRIFDKKNHNKTLQSQNHLIRNPDMKYEPAKNFILQKQKKRNMRKHKTRRLKKHRQNTTKNLKQVYMSKVNPNLIIPLILDKAKIQNRRKFPKMLTHRKEKLKFKIIKFNKINQRPQNNMILDISITTKKLADETNNVLDRDGWNTNVTNTTFEEKRKSTNPNIVEHVSGKNESISLNSSGEKDLSKYDVNKKARSKRVLTKEAIHKELLKKEVSQDVNKEVSNESLVEKMLIGKDDSKNEFQILENKTVLKSNGQMASHKDNVSEPIWAKEFILDNPPLNVESPNEVYKEDEILSSKKVVSSLDNKVPKENSQHRKVKKHVSEEEILEQLLDQDLESDAWSKMFFEKEDLENVLGKESSGKVIENNHLGNEFLKKPVVEKVVLNKDVLNKKIPNEKVWNETNLTSSKEISPANDLDKLVLVNDAFSNTLDKPILDSNTSGVSKHTLNNENPKLLKDKYPTKEFLNKGVLNTGNVMTLKKDIFQKDLGKPIRTYNTSKKMVGVPRILEFLNNIQRNDLTDHPNEEPRLTVTHHEVYDKNLNKTFFEKKIMFQDFSNIPVPKHKNVEIVNLTIVGHQFSNFDPEHFIVEEPIGLNIFSQDTINKIVDGVIKINQPVKNVLEIDIKKIKNKDSSQDDGEDSDQEIEELSREIEDEKDAEQEAVTNDNPTQDFMDTTDHNHKHTEMDDPNQEQNSIKELTNTQKPYQQLIEEDSNQNQNLFEEVTVAEKPNQQLFEEDPYPEQNLTEEVTDTEKPNQQLIEEDSSWDQIPIEEVTVREKPNQEFIEEDSNRDQNPTEGVIGTDKPNQQLFEEDSYKEQNLTEKVKDTEKPNQQLIGEDSNWDQIPIEEVTVREKPNHQLIEVPSNWDQIPIEEVTVTEKPNQQFIEEGSNQNLFEEVTVAETPSQKLFEEDTNQEPNLTEKFTDTEKPNQQFIEEDSNQNLFEEVTVAETPSQKLFEEDTNQEQNPSKEVIDTEKSNQQLNEEDSNQDLNPIEEVTVRENPNQQFIEEDSNQNQNLFEEVTVAEKPNQQLFEDDSHQENLTEEVMDTEKPNQQLIEEESNQDLNPIEEVTVREKPSQQFVEENSNQNQNPIEGVTVAENPSQKLFEDTYQEQSLTEEVTDAEKPNQQFFEEDSYQEQNLTEEATDTDKPNQDLIEEDSNQNLDLFEEVTVAEKPNQQLFEEDSYQEQNPIEEVSVRDIPNQQFIKEDSNHEQNLTEEVTDTEKPNQDLIEDDSNQTLNLFEEVTVAEKPNQQLFEKDPYPELNLTEEVTDTEKPNQHLIEEDSNQDQNPIEEVTVKEKPYQKFIEEDSNQNQNLIEEVTVAEKPSQQLIEEDSNQDQNPIERVTDRENLDEELKKTPNPVDTETLMQKIFDGDTNEDTSEKEIPSQEIPDKKINKDIFNKYLLNRDFLYRDILNKDIVERDALIRDVLDENSLSKDSLDENSLSKDSLDENSLSKDVLDENSLSKDVLDENSLNNDVLDENSLNKDVLDENSLNKNVLNDNSLSKDVLDEISLNKNVLNENSLSKDMLDSEILTDDTTDNGTNNENLDKEFLDDPDLDQESLNQTDLHTLESNETILSDKVIDDKNLSLKSTPSEVSKDLDKLVEAGKALNIDILSLILQKIIQVGVPDKEAILKALYDDIFGNATHPKRLYRVPQMGNNTHRITNKNIMKKDLQREILESNINLRHVKSKRDVQYTMSKKTPEEEILYKDIHKDKNDVEKDIYHPTLNNEDNVIKALDSLTTESNPKKEIQDSVKDRQLEETTRIPKNDKDQNIIRKAIMDEKDLREEPDRNKTNLHTDAKDTKILVEDMQDQNVLHKEILHETLNQSIFLKNNLFNNTKDKKDFHDSKNNTKRTHENNKNNRISCNNETFMEEKDNKENVGDGNDFMKKKPATNLEVEVKHETIVNNRNKKRKNKGSAASKDGVKSRKRNRRIKKLGRRKIFNIADILKRMKASDLIGVETGVTRAGVMVTTRSKPNNLERTKRKYENHNESDPKLIKIANNPNSVKDSTKRERNGNFSKKIGVLKKEHRREVRNSEAKREVVVRRGVRRKYLKNFKDTKENKVHNKKANGKTHQVPLSKSKEIINGKNDMKNHRGNTSLEKGNQTSRVNIEYKKTNGRDSISKVVGKHKIDTTKTGNNQKVRTKGVGMDTKLAKSFKPGDLNHVVKTKPKNDTTLTINQSKVKTDPDSRNTTNKVNNQKEDFSKNQTKHSQEKPKIWINLVRVNGSDTVNQKEDYTKNLVEPNQETATRITLTGNGNSTEMDNQKDRKNLKELPQGKLETKTNIGVTNNESHTDEDDPTKNLTKLILETPKSRIILGLIRSNHDLTNNQKVENQEKSDEDNIILNFMHSLTKDSISKDNALEGSKVIDVITDNKTGQNRKAINQTVSKTDQSIETIVQKHFREISSGAQNKSAENISIMPVIYSEALEEMVNKRIVTMPTGIEGQFKDGFNNQSKPIIIRYNGKKDLIKNVWKDNESLTDMVPNNQTGVEDSRKKEAEKNKTMGTESKKNGTTDDGLKKDDKNETTMNVTTNEIVKNATDRNQTNKNETIGSEPARKDTNETKDESEVEKTDEVVLIKEITDQFFKTGPFDQKKRRNASFFGQNLTNQNTTDDIDSKYEIKKKKSMKRLYLMQIEGKNNSEDENVFDEALDHLSFFGQNLKQLTKQNKTNVHDGTQMKQNSSLDQLYLMQTEGRGLTDNETVLEKNLDKENTILGRNMTKGNEKNESDPSQDQKSSRRGVLDFEENQNENSTNQTDTGRHDSNGGDGKKNEENGTNPTVVTSDENKDEEESSTDKTSRDEGTRQVEGEKSANNTAVRKGKKRRIKKLYVRKLPKRLRGRLGKRRFIKKIRDKNGKVKHVLLTTLSTRKFLVGSKKRASKKKPIKKFNPDSLTKDFYQSYPSTSINEPDAEESGKNRSKFSNRRIANKISRQSTKRKWRRKLARKPSKQLLEKPSQEQLDREIPIKKVKSQKLLHKGISLENLSSQSLLAQKLKEEYPIWKKIYKAKRAKLQSRKLALARKKSNKRLLKKTQGEEISKTISENDTTPNNDSSKNLLTQESATPTPTTTTTKDLITSQTTSTTTTSTTTTSTTTTSTTTTSTTTTPKTPVTEQAEEDSDEDQTVAPRKKARRRKLSLKRKLYLKRKLRRKQRRNRKRNKLRRRGRKYKSNNVKKTFSRLFLDNDYDDDDDEDDDEDDDDEEEEETPTTTEYRKPRRRIVTRSPAEIEALERRNKMLSMIKPVYPKTTLSDFAKKLIYYAERAKYQNYLAFDDREEEDARAHFRQFYSRRMNDLQKFVQLKEEEIKRKKQQEEARKLQEEKNRFYFGDPYMN